MRLAIPLELPEAFYAKHGFSLDLTPDEIVKTISPTSDDDPMCVFRFVSLSSGWQWFAWEARKIKGPEYAYLRDGETDVILSGYVVGICPESGTFTKRELAETSLRQQMPILRDLKFEPTRLSVLDKRYGDKYGEEIDAELLRAAEEANSRLGFIPVDMVANAVMMHEPVQEQG